MHNYVSISVLFCLNTGAWSRARASVEDQNYGFWGLITCWSISSGPELRVSGPHHVLEHPLKTGITGFGASSRAGSCTDRGKSLFL